MAMKFHSKFTSPKRKAGWIKSSGLKQPHQQRRQIYWNNPAATINIVTLMQTTLSGTTQTFSTNFQFSYPANAGLSYIVRRSTNLAPANWITLVTNVAASNPLVFVDNHATNGLGFTVLG